MVSNVTRLTYDVVATYTATGTGTWTSVLRGRFSDTPDEHVCYCNSKEVPQVWGGDQTQLSSFEVVKRSHLFFC